MMKNDIDENLLYELEMCRHFFQSYVDLRNSYIESFIDFTDEELDALIEKQIREYTLLELEGHEEKKTNVKL